MTLTSNTRTVAGAIDIIDDAIDNCEQVLDAVQETAVWSDALIENAGSGYCYQEMRDNSVTSFDPLSFRTSEVLHRFAKTVWMYADLYAVRYSVSFSGIEHVNINRYEPGQQYSVHADASPFLPRVISALVYLNDVEDGGETEFVNFGERVTPKAGRLVIFPSNYAYAHAALPPASGMKYSAAFWFRS